MIDPASRRRRCCSRSDAYGDAELLAAFEIAPASCRTSPDCASLGRSPPRAHGYGLSAGTPSAVGTATISARRSVPASHACAPHDLRDRYAEVAGTLARNRSSTPLPSQCRDPCLSDADTFFVENPAGSRAAPYAGAARARHRDDREFDALAAAAPPGADGVTFVPALTGAMTPVWRPNARGTFHGLAASHERHHLARAVLEGLAFASRDVSERLAEMQLPTDRVLLLGGGSRSDTWSQIRADVLGKPHDVAWSADTCPVGAAMIAAVAAGIHPDLAACARLVPTPAKTFAPRASLDAAYQRYQQLVTQLAPLATVPWPTGV